MSVLWDQLFDNKSEVNIQIFMVFYYTFSFDIYLSHIYLY